MAGYVLDAGTTIMCPHLGKASVSPMTTDVKLGGQAPLVVADFVAPVISGCVFTIGPNPSPCLTVQWQMPATRVTFNGSPPLLSTSVPMCLNAAGVPQGTALVSGFQTKVQAT